MSPGRTCGDWTSDASDMQAQVGHSDGLGPGGDPSDLRMELVAWEWKLRRLSHRAEDGHFNF